MDTSRADRAAESSESHAARWFALVGEVRRRLGPGAAVSPTARRFFQGHLAADAGGVMVHRGPFAGYLAAGLQAEAATVDGHVFGGDDRLAEDSPAGAALLGHELVHATAGQATLQRAADDGDGDADDDDEERRAEAMEALVTEIVSDIEASPAAEDPAPRVRPVNVAAVAERVYARIVDRLRDERERGAW